MEQAAGKPRRIAMEDLPPHHHSAHPPGLFAGLTLVLIPASPSWGPPLMFSYYTITPVQVFHQITDVADNPLPYALVVVMLIASSPDLYRRKINPRAKLRSRHHQSIYRLQRKKTHRHLRLLGRTSVHHRD